MKRDLSYKTEKINERGKDVWRIRIGFKINKNGKRTSQYLRFKTEVEADRESKRLFAKQAADDALGVEALKLSNAHDIAACVKDLGVIGATVRDAATFYLKFHSGSSKIAAKKAVEEFNKHNSKRIRRSTRGNYERKAKHFAADFGDQSVSTITKAELNKWIDEKTVGGTS